MIIDVKVRLQLQNLEVNLNQIQKIEQGINKDDLVNKTGNKRKVKHMILKSLKQ